MREFSEPRLEQQVNTRHLVHVLKMIFMSDAYESSQSDVL